LSSLIKNDLSKADGWRTENSSGTGYFGQIKLFKSCAAFKRTAPASAQGLGSRWATPVLADSGHVCYWSVLAPLTGQGNAIGAGLSPVQAISDAIYGVRFSDDKFAGWDGSNKIGETTYTAGAWYNFKTLINESTLTLSYKLATDSSWTDFGDASIVLPGVAVYPAFGIYGAVGKTHYFAELDYTDDGFSSDVAQVKTSFQMIWSGQESEAADKKTFFSNFKGVSIVGELAAGETLSPIKAAVKTWSCDTLQPFTTIQDDGTIYVTTEADLQFIRHQKLTTGLDGKNGLYTTKVFRMVPGDRLAGKWRSHEAVLGSGSEAFIQISKSAAIAYGAACHLYVVPPTGWSQASSECTTDTNVAYATDTWWRWLFEMQNDGSIFGFVRKDSDINYTQIMHTNDGSWTGVDLYFTTNIVSGYATDGGNLYDLDEITLSNSADL
jgi:hypothetical protein